MNADQRQDAAALLVQTRAELSKRLAALVKEWPKYSAQYASDPVAFAEIECAALVDYLATYLRDEDAAFLHLYVGEKAKQFHESSAAGEERRERERVVLAGEQAVFVEALKEFPEAQAAVRRAFQAITDALTGEASHELRILFVGDCLYLDVIAFLTAPALADGIRINPSFVASHDVGEIQAALGKWAREPFDLVFLSPFTYSLLSDYEALQRVRLVPHPSKARQHAREAVRLAELLFDTAADLFECPLVVHVPAPVLRHEGTLRERASDLLTRSMRKRATKALKVSFRERATARRENGQSVMLIDEAEVTSTVGLRAAGRYYHRLALQHPARFGALLAEFYSHILFAAAKLSKRKVVVCDLDETLWQGVIGEGFGVRHYRSRQDTLLSLKKRGVVLAINSKNDPAKVSWDAIESALSLDDFVSRQINWEPKAMNMRRIAEHLNLKEKDFIFIDDRADERAMINEAYPEIVTLDACQERSWKRLRVWAELLPARPDMDRTEFYRQRDAREAFISADAETGAAQRNAMYEKLNLQLLIREAGSEDVIRVTDLINRTNQFNMTAARVTRGQVQQSVASEDTRVLIADAEDRFGSMGTIAVLVAKRSQARIEIPVFVLSCRVFGYDMEFAMLEQARRLAREEDTIFGRFLATEHNQPCQGVYPSAGFSPAPGGWELASAAKSTFAVPAWLTVHANVRPFPA